MRWSDEIDSFIGVDHRARSRHFVHLLAIFSQSDHRNSFFTRVESPSDSQAHEHSQPATSPSEASPDADVVPGRELYKTHQRR